jgi:hypothetical protein
VNRATRSLSAVLAVSMMSSPLFAQQHIVTREDAAARLEAAAAEREANRGKVDRVLATAAGAGLEVGRLRSMVATLSDDELRDLAARAQALQTDPVAGASGKKILVIVGIVVVVVVVLGILIVEDCKRQGAECLN